MFGTDRTFIVAEIGSNHNQDKDVLKKLLDAAGRAKVDAVKFQTFFHGDIASKYIKADAYGKFEFTEGKETWNEVLDSLSLPVNMYDFAFKYSRELGLIPFATPESSGAVDFLEKLNVGLYKISSTDLTYESLVRRVAETGKPVIISTGMSSLAEVRDAYSWIKEASSASIGILHCISKYPPEYSDLNLRKIEMYKSEFPDAVIGFSDHSPKIYPSLGAVALGGRIIEKHITLDRYMKGPDHAFATEPEEFKELVKGIRIIEESLKESTQADLEIGKEYRRSATYASDMKIGEILTKDDIVYKRPGTGIPPSKAKELIGLKLRKDVKEEQLIQLEDLE